MLLEYFQMIDRVDAIDPADGTIAARALVPGESPVFEGHFPGHPLVPGVLLIETMAQASGFLVMARLGYRQLPLLMQVREAKLRSFVGPEAALDIEAGIEHEGSGFTATRAAIRSDGKRVADARLMFRVMDFPHPDLKAAMHARAREIGVPGGMIVAAGEPGPGA